MPFGILKVCDPGRSIFVLWNRARGSRENNTPEEVGIRRGGDFAGHGLGCDDGMEERLGSAGICRWLAKWQLAQFQFQDEEINFLSSIGGLLISKF